LQFVNAELLMTALPVVLALLVGSAPLATFAPQVSRSQNAAGEVSRFAATLVDFGERIDDYMDLREDIVDEVGDPDSTNDPARIRAREEALASRIRVARRGARHGDILTPEIRAAFRRLLSPHTSGEAGRELKSTVQEDSPAPGAVPLEVNAKYPAGVPFSTTPPNVLGALPLLPRGLEYRFVGEDLILLDQPADVILDYIRNVIRSSG
jgi:hypothetical protein